MTRSKVLLASAVCTLAGATTVTALHTSGSIVAGPFSAAQVVAGKQAYEAHCAGCHQSSLAGQGDAMPLTGAGFRLAWEGRTTSELYKQIHDTMPFGVGGSLSEETYADILAYILSVNGAQPGAAALTAASSGTRIADVIAPAVAEGGAPKVAGAAHMSAKAVKPTRNVREASTASSAKDEGLTLQGHIQNYSDVTDAMLRNPSNADWIMYRGGYRGWSYSTLDAINVKNVSQLQLVWSWAMTAGGTQETTPLIHDGVMFLWNPGNVMQAFRADTGELLWENRIGPAPQRAFGAGSDANRTIALYKDKVFLSTNEAKLFALDARTGKIVWQSDIGEPSLNFGKTTAGVIVVNGKVISGLTACGGPGSPADEKAHCYISAYDANTGERVWKFQTVALDGEPGGETWNGIPDSKRAGGETWILGTYDADLNLMYWGTAQAKPWRRDMRGTGDASTLYTSNTIAIDPDSGKLKWHFSHQPGETLDLDEAFERVLVDEGDRKVLLTVGKPGFLWKLDRVTGDYLGSVPTVLNNVAKVDHNVGIPILRPDIVNQKLADWIASCPGPQGGHDWQTTSYHAPSNILLPLLNFEWVMQDTRVLGRWGQGRA